MYSLDEIIARGRLLAQRVAAGEPLPDDMSSMRDHNFYMMEQRQLADRTGECEGGCDRTTLIPHRHHTNQLVCPKTYRVCDKRCLAEIVSQFGVIHDNSNSSSQGTCSISVSRARS